MSRELAILVMLLAGGVTAVSQVILKVSARRKAPTGLAEYLNPHVLTAYFLLLGATFLSVIAFRGIEYKLGPMLGLSSYVFVLVLGVLFLKEPMTMKKIMGNFLIVAGIVIFALG